MDLSPEDIEEIPVLDPDDTEDFNGDDLELLEDLDEDISGAPDDEDISSIIPSLAPLENTIFPVIVINHNFKIIYANPPGKQLFSDYFKLEGNSLMDVFGKSFGIEALKDIREAVMNGKDGYSWKGTVKVKSREMVTVQTRCYLFPLDIQHPVPRAFEIMFDDVTEENKMLLRSVFLSLLEASKLKDNDTGKHISRVNYYSKRFAEELYKRPGFGMIDADFIDDIGFLASMHDVGKIGTPDDILNKEDPLSDWEWTVMQEHTKNGAYILSTYPNPMAKEIALSHHERWNGSGYPFQLEGEMIPLPARIVSIADVYDALRMTRSYKPAFDHSKAVEIINEEKGTQFDPLLVDVFNTIAGEFSAIYEEHKD
ncbi:HD domain-containing protein [Treponema sp. OttesenSCG-928-L16]|nr:HD domain-containing protein [Treponema sp. OttesenSCG-928-L16]